jgi:hypothetical protein
MSAPVETSKDKESFVTALIAPNNLRAKLLAINTLNALANATLNLETSNSAKTQHIFFIANYLYNVIPQGKEFDALKTTLIKLISTINDFVSNPKLSTADESSETIKKLETELSVQNNMLSEWKKRFLDSAKESRKNTWENAPDLRKRLEFIIDKCDAIFARTEWAETITFYSIGITETNPIGTYDIKEANGKWKYGQDFPNLEYFKMPYAIKNNCQKTISDLESLIYSESHLTVENYEPVWVNIKKLIVPA